MEAVGVLDDWLPEGEWAMGVESVGARIVSDLDMSAMVCVGSPSG